MRSRAATIVLSFLLLGALVATTGPAGGHGASLYTMEGGGNLQRVSGPGLAFSGPSTTTVYKFATLPIRGDGLLNGHLVAALYNCPSSVTIKGVGLNFSINWKFTCTRTSGTGPNPIKGAFTGKYPIFRGTFKPYINGVQHQTARSICTGVAIPTQVQSGHIMRMTFVGECNVP